MPFFERHVMFDMLMEHDFLPRRMNIILVPCIMCISRTSSYCNHNWRIIYLSSQSLEQKRRMKLIIQREEENIIIIIKYRTMSISNALYSAYDSNYM